MERTSTLDHASRLQKEVACREPAPWATAAAPGEALESWGCEPGPTTSDRRRSGRSEPRLSPQPPSLILGFRCPRKTRSHSEAYPMSR